MSGHTSFTREAFAALRADPREGPIHMLNLVRLNDVAIYENGEQRSGRDAYEAYGNISGPVFSALGGRIVWRGRFEQGLIAPDNETWDICFIAEYPSIAAFVSMFKNPTYREAMIHRQAAVRDSRLIRLAPMAAGARFDDRD